jgi:aminopeptidase
VNLPSDARSVLYRKYACVLLDHVLSVAADDLVAVVPHAYDAAFMNLLQTEASNRNVTLLELSPGSDPDIVDRLIDEDGALLHLLGGSRLSLPFLKPFMQLGKKLERRWSLAVFPDQAWADLLFPGVQDGFSRLEDVVFDILRLHENDPTLAWESLDSRFRKRAALLNDAAIGSLQVTGPDTSLTVGLSDRAVWKGGRKLFSNGRLGWTNFPCGEIFTTPDRCKTEGKINITTPVATSSGVINGITLQFERGCVVHAQATEGETILRSLLAKDGGSGYLGEFALAGADSPCSRYPLYHHSLPDEKRRCHLALGDGYPHCIRDFDSLSAEQLADIGFNTSSIHADLMWGDVGVQVSATNTSGTMPILDGFAWATWLD